MMAARNVRGGRLLCVQDTLNRHGIPYDFSQDPDGNAGLRWRYKGKTYSVMQKNGNAGLIARLDKTMHASVSQNYVCKHIDNLIESEG